MVGRASIYEMWSPELLMVGQASEASGHDMANPGFVFGFMYVLSDVCWDIECPEYVGAIVIVLTSCQL